MIRGPLREPTGGSRKPGSNRGDPDSNDRTSRLLYNHLPDATLAIGGAGSKMLT
ncbi:MAG: hypothetical protein P4L51_05520 [Puia sp.]|nr:hypothetical protein [Puia sp.]